MRNNAVLQKYDISICCDTTASYYATTISQASFFIAFIYSQTSETN